MSKYVELNELQKFCREYTEVDAVGLIRADRTDLLHTVEAIPLDKVKRAKEGMQDSKFDGKTVLTYNDAIDDCVKILDKLIESE